MGERILENFTIDQLAGSTALILGALGGLLTIIWKSRCLCRCRVGLSDKCYIFDCSREPPPVEEKKEEGEEQNTDEEESVLPSNDLPKTTSTLSKTQSQKLVNELELVNKHLDEQLDTPESPKP